MLESVFFLVTLVFTLLFLILSVAVQNWPCGGVFSEQCQNNEIGYATRPVGALICISIILYTVSAVIDLVQVNMHLLDDKVRKIMAYTALALSCAASLFVVSGLLAFFSLYMKAWCVMLSVVGMTLGCSLTFQLVMHLLLDQSPVTPESK